MDWDGLDGLDLCAGLLYEHRFAMLIKQKILFMDSFSPAWLNPFMKTSTLTVSQLLSSQFLLSQFILSQLLLSQFVLSQFILSQYVHFSIDSPSNLAGGVKRLHCYTKATPQIQSFIVIPIFLRLHHNQRLALHLNLLSTSTFESLSSTSL